MLCNHINILLAHSRSTAVNIPHIQLFNVPSLLNYQYSIGKTFRIAFKLRKHKTVWSMSSAEKLGVHNVTHTI